MINKLWGFFIILGSLFFIKSGKINELNLEILKSATIGLESTVKIFPILALWLGISKIAEDSGLLNKISKKMKRLLKLLFPEIPENNKSLDYISCNVISNMMGLGNVATPFGIKAMHELQKINKNKQVASRSMITFLVLNTSGLTLIPTTVISLRMMYDSLEPTKIIIPCIIITFINTFLALIIDRIFSKFQI